MNQVIIDGRIIPNTEKSDKNYVFYPATGDPANGGKQAFLHFLLSTRKEGAPKGQDGYYPTEIWPVKAFGPTAEQINQYFGPNTGIMLFGVLGEDDPYVGSDGVERKGNKHIKANRIVYGYGGKPKDEAAAAVPRTVTGTTTKSTNNQPLLRRSQNKVVAPF